MAKTERIHLWPSLIRVSTSAFFSIVGAFSSSSSSSSSSPTSPSAPASPSPSPAGAGSGSGSLFLLVWSPSDDWLIEQGFSHLVNLDQSDLVPDAKDSGWWTHSIGDIPLPTPRTVTPDMTP